MAKKDKKEEKILEQTRGTFVAVGKVSGVENDNFYKTGILEKGKAEGKEFRSLRFGLQTSPNQKITLQMFGIEPDVVYVWDNEKKKSEAVSYDDFLDNYEQWAEDGKVTFDSSISLDGVGKDAPRLHLPKFDGIEEIYNKLSNGMTVYVRGNISRNQYENANGELVNRTNYDVTQINLNNDIDFDSDDFVEKCSFKEQFVFTEAEHNREDDEVLVYGLAIDYNENTLPTTYSIPLGKKELVIPDGATEAEVKKLTDENEKEYKNRVAMAKAYLKAVKYGDLLTIEGDILNAVRLVEVEDDDDDDVLGALKGNATQAVRDYINKLILRGTVAREAKKYKEEDFIKAQSKNQVIEDDDDDMGALSGNKSTKDDDDSPFGSSSTIDIDDDDLPF